MRNSRKIQTLEKKLREAKRELREAVSPETNDVAQTVASRFLDEIDEVWDDFTMYEDSAGGLSDADRDILVEYAKQMGGDEVDASEAEALVLDYIQDFVSGSKIPESEIPEIERLYDKAAGAWEGADWTHEQYVLCDAPEHGSYQPCPQCRMVKDDYGEAVLCAGDNADECQVCIDAEEDAQRAEWLAFDAMEALRAGDVDQAQELAERVYNLEADYGGAQVWGPWADAIEQLDR